METQISLRSEITQRCRANASLSGLSEIQTLSPEEDSQDDSTPSPTPEKLS